MEINNNPKDRTNLKLAEPGELFQKRREEAMKRAREAREERARQKQAAEEAQAAPQPDPEK